MTDELKPYQIIEKLAEERRAYSDAQVLVELVGLPVLPDEDDPAWNTAERSGPWAQLDLYLAFGYVATDRKLRPALLLLLEKSCYGDPGETMRGLCHILEYIVDGDWNYLAEVCMEATKSTQPGARLWAVSELGRLQKAKSLPTLIRALEDERQLVREAACFALGTLCFGQRECRPAAIEALERYWESLPVGREKDVAIEKLDYVEHLR